MQVLLATVLINALHAALENAEEALDGVRRDQPLAFLARIFVAGMVHGVVALKGRAGLLVVASLVSVERRVQNDVFAQNALDGRDRQIVDLDGNGAATALNHRQHLGFG